MNVENCSVGIDADEFTPISLFPNPASGMVFVRFTLVNDSHIRLSIINILGQ